ncbi:MAG: ABC transporter permease subunit [Synechococcales cyanobacterium T60_A2020_003]|nr:ABC transporter permease subunit [Synechococcales cyanobacterium T60_A2020_003]
MTIGTEEKIPLWRDERFWKIAFQAIVVAILVVMASILIGNLNRNMQQKGIQFGFSFLSSPAGFSIGETILPFLPNDPYIRALMAGMANTLRVVVFGIFFTTILGIAAGIASFSSNWLVRKLSFGYVEIVRNTPLLLQLFFWYFAVFFGLPKPDEPDVWLNSVFLSKAGIYIPWPGNTVSVWLWIAILVLGAIATLFIWKWRTYLMVERGESGKPQIIALAVLAIAAILIFIWGLNWQFPSIGDNGQASGGLRLSLEFSALLAGLVFYTGAFIAEIVRAGIQSVSRGQWEAARSLGLQQGLVMQLVVFPQALRVILPSLNSQYQNLTKNSSLGFAIAYPEIYSVSNTTYNQTGRPVEVFILIMAAFLLTNLMISAFMNWLNGSVQLKER